MRLAILLAVSGVLALQAQRQPLQFEVTWVNRPSTLPAGVQHRTLQSPSMKHEVGWSIYLPPEYDSSQQRYPVVYWLHGAGGNETSGYLVAKEFDAAVRAGLTGPAISRLSERREEDRISRLAGSECDAGNDDHPGTDSVR